MSLNENAIEVSEDLEAQKQIIAKLMDEQSALKFEISNQFSQICQLQQMVQSYENVYNSDQKIIADLVYQNKVVSNQVEYLKTNNLKLKAENKALLAEFENVSVYGG